MPPLIVTGNPPTIQGSGYQAVEVLGKLLNIDLNMSPFKNEASAFCHMPYAGFSGPIPSVNLTMTAYPGTYHFRARQADSATIHLFTGLSPVREQALDYMAVVRWTTTNPGGDDDLTR